MKTDLKYYVLVDYGSCNDGNHYFELAEFETLKAAREHAQYHAQRAIAEDGTVKIILGREIK